MGRSISRADKTRRDTLLRVLVVLEVVVLIIPPAILLLVVLVATISFSLALLQGTLRPEGLLVGNTVPAHYHEKSSFRRSGGRKYYAFDYCSKAAISSS